MAGHLTKLLFSVQALLQRPRSDWRCSAASFLLLKATMELNERLEGKEAPTLPSVVSEVVVAQMWCWTPSFLDSVITAVGMVDHRRS
ncbi:hypothetical protein KCP75_10820 [Salmonella enterica subsp. enterica]|nr:hypothetical protein KCP75_10820 [Salmonella enterica subsp. enterica]